MQITSANINGFPIHSIVSDIGFVVHQDAAGFDFPGVRFNSYPRPGEHGAVVPNEFLDGRTMTLNGRVSGNTPSVYALNRRSLLNALRIVMDSLGVAQPHLLQFTTIDGLNLQCYCFLSQPPIVPEASLNHGKFQIQLFSPNPYLYDQNIQTFTLSVPVGGGVVYPVIYPVTYAAKTGGTMIITNAGDAETYPIVTLYGPLTSPYIRNFTTGAQFQIDGTLNTGDVLAIDMGGVVQDAPAKTMLLNGITNAMGYFDYLNTWLAIVPGGNTVSLGSGLSADTGYMTLQLRNAWVGV